MNHRARTRGCGAWHTSRTASARSLTCTCTPCGPPAARLRSSFSYRPPCPAPLRHPRKTQGQVSLVSYKGTLTDLLAFVFGVADVGACLLQVIPADKCVLLGNSHQENQEWLAKGLGLASYRQDKLVELAQMCAGNDAVQWCT